GVGAVPVVVRVLAAVVSRMEQIGRPRRQVDGRRATGVAGRVQGVAQGDVVVERVGLGGVVLHDDVGVVVGNVRGVDDVDGIAAVDLVGAQVGVQTAAVTALVGTVDARDKRPGLRRRAGGQQLDGLRRPAVVLQAAGVELGVGGEGV